MLDDSAADKSVEEILKEAEDLVRETSHSFSALTDGRDLLSIPVTPELIATGQATNLLPAPSIKSKSQRTEELSRDKRTSIRSSSAPPTSRKAGEKIAKVKGGRISGTKSSYSIRHTDSGLDRNEDDKIDLTLRKSKSFASDRIDTNKNIPNQSSSKIKDISKKERTVKFNEDFVSPETEKSNVPNTQVSSQIAEDTHGTLADEFKQYSKKENDSSSAGNSVTQDKISSRKRHMTDIVSVSPPLIQHGDVVGTPEAIFQLIDDEVRNEIVAALKVSSVSNINSKETNSNNKELENNTFSIEQEMGEMFSHDSNNSAPQAEIIEISGTSLKRQPLPVVFEESSLSETSSDVKDSESYQTTKNDHSKDISVQVTDSTLMEQIENLKEELAQARKKILHYKGKNYK